MAAFLMLFNMVITGLSYLADVLGLGALGTVNDLEFNLFSLGQSLIPISRNRTVVNKDVLFTRLLDESIPLGVVEPLNLARYLGHKNKSLLKRSADVNCSQPN